MSSITCPSCQTVSPAGAIFCDSCGYDLRSVAPVSPSAAPPTIATPSSGELACQSCGHVNLPGSTFCENCGVQVPQTAQPQSQQPPAVEQPYQAPPQEQPVQPAQSMPPVEQAQSQPPQQDIPPPLQQPPVEQQVPVSTPETPPYQTPVEPIPATPTSAPSNRLVITASNVSLQIPPGKQEIIIGREDPVSSMFPDIDLDPHGGQEAGVGRQHAKITYQGVQAYIEDLNSVNGTSVNKQRIPPGQPLTLNNGDEIRLGIMALTYFSN